MDLKGSRIRILQIFILYTSKYVDLKGSRIPQACSKNCQLCHIFQKLPTLPCVRMRVERRVQAAQGQTPLVYCLFQQLNNFVAFTNIKIKYVL